MKIDSSVSFYRDDIPVKKIEALQRLGTPHHGEAHHEEGKSKLGEVMWNMLNSIIGAGIVGLPNVYKEAGLAGGIIAILFFAIVSTYTLRLLVIIFFFLKPFFCFFPYSIFFHFLVFYFLFLFLCFFFVLSFVSFRNKLHKNKSATRIFKNKKKQ